MAVNRQSHGNSVAIDQRMSALEGDVCALRRELEKLRAQFGMNSPTLSNQHQDTLGDDAPRPLGITEAIVEVLSENPGGLARVQLSESVAPRVFSKSADPRHTIHVTLNRLERNGRIGRVGELYYLARDDHRSESSIPEIKGALELFGSA